jgi:hypothetical protein
VISGAAPSRNSRQVNSDSTNVSASKGCRSSRTSPTPMNLIGSFMVWYRGPALACCKVGLDRPLIPTTFIANLFRSARVSRPRRLADRRSPRDVSPAGDWETCARRGWAVGRPLPEPAFEGPGSSRAWLGGPTDARENLKKLRHQLGLRNN